MPTNLKPACLGVIDCNNFFVSCERIFRPDLWRTPIIVLSNNDGCVVARSNEVRALGITVGQPVFQLRSTIQANRIKVFSGNFHLYHNISQRVMKLIKAVCPQVEAYSVDEAFIDLSCFKSTERLAKMLKLRQDIWQEIGVPVSIGLAKTKTLAKLANEIVKNLDRGKIQPDLTWPSQPAGGVLDLSNTANLTSFRRCMEVSDVWGIGRKTAPKLKLLGIHTAENLAGSSDSLTKSLLHLPGQQTKLELQGQCCWPLHHQPSQNQSLMVSRSFGQPVAEFDSLASAISQFAEAIAEKLRHQRQLTKNLSVFIIWKENRASTSQTITLAEPTQLASSLVKTAIAALKLCLTSQSKLAIKAGVYTSGPIPEVQIQPGLFTNQTSLEKLHSLQKTQQAMDKLNRKYGSQTIQIARSIRPSQTASWASRQTAKSPDYVTSWAALVKVF